jgi:hypothetical protein
MMLPLSHTAGVAILVAVTACSRHPSECPVTGTFESRMVDTALNNRMGGLVFLDGRDGRVALSDTTDEGTVEDRQAPIERLVLQGDSIRFQFGASAIQVVGMCFGRDSIRGTFVDAGWNPPPHGVWVMHRVEKPSSVP